MHQPKYPLFVLQVGKPGAPYSAEISKETEGIWKKRNGKYLFTTETLFLENKVSLTLIPEQELSFLLPFLEYSAENQVPMVLHGRQEQDLYFVYGLRPIGEKT